MNVSSKCLIDFFNKYTIPDISKFVIVTDYLEINLGKVLYRTGGSSKGHNGLKNIYTYVRDTMEVDPSKV